MTTNWQYCDNIIKPDFSSFTEITNSTDVAKCDSEMLQKYHFKMIVQDGIFFLPGKLGAISISHSKEDIKKMIQASENF